jgi:2-polyprenyl-3-methyl-5-hydroxy-6-metoxy-1,4-benzoquinol methylase
MRPTTPAEDDSIREMLAANERQSEYYNHRQQQRGNLITRAWSRGRNALYAAGQAIGVREVVTERHREWFGDVASVRILDLGCGCGTPIALEMAGKCADYLAIDLSELNVQRMNQKLKGRQLANARALRADFLSPEFEHGPFDVIYASAIMHHFRHFDEFLRVLHDCLSPNGVIIAHEPLNTALEVRLARAIYRPFQSDSDWEFPLTRHSFGLIERYFHIEAVQGIWGRSKWALPLFVFAPLERLGTRVGKRLHGKDLELAGRVGPGLWTCMQVAMLLRRRELK